LSGLAVRYAPCDGSAVENLAATDDPEDSGANAFSNVMLLARSNHTALLDPILGFRNMRM
jgi:hypothetical protein